MATGEVKSSCEDQEPCKFKKKRGKIKTQLSRLDAIIQIDIYRGSGKMVTHLYV